MAHGLLEYLEEQSCGKHQPRVEVHDVEDTGAEEQSRNEHRGAPDRDQVAIDIVVGSPNVAELKVPAAVDTLMEVVLCRMI